MNNNLTQERLKELVHYNPETGVFTCLKQVSNRKVGDILGTVQNEKGYLVARIDNKGYRLHRLAFLYMNGNLPAKLVDHINGSTADNRWCNLREVTAMENLQNAKCSKVSTTGIKGLIFKDIKHPLYEASIKVKGKRYTKSMCIRGRDELEIIKELTAWLKETREKHHGEFANHG